MTARPIQRILRIAFFGAVGLMALGGAGTVLHLQSPLFRPVGIALAAGLAVLFVAGSLLFLARPFREGVAVLRDGGLARFATWCAGGADEIDGTDPDGIAKLTGVGLFGLYSTLALTVVGWTAWALVARLL